MVEVSLKEIFEVGTNFDASVGCGSKGERNRIPKNYSRLSLTDEMVSILESIDEEINFLVSGEIWCPDYQLNATVLKRFAEINSNFNISVITMARGKKFLAPILNRDKESLKFPLIIVLNKDFKILGTFEERPKSVVSIADFDEIKLDYYKGKYLLDTASDIIKIIKEYR